MKIPEIEVHTTRGPFELHRLPNGDQIWYRDDSHSYWENTIEKGGKWCGQGRLMGCSTFVKHAEHDAGPLMGWAGKRNVAGMCELIDRSINGLLDVGYSDDLKDQIAWATDEQQAMSMLRENKLTWADKRDEAGDEGTVAHDTFEALLRGGSVDWMNVPDGAVEKVKAVEKFIADYSPEPLNLEQVIYSKKHGYAGRFDARLRVNSIEDGTAIDETWLLDLKTSGFIAPGYFVQLAAYRMAARECGVGDVDRMMILQVSPEGGYRLIESHATDEDVIACLRLHRQGKTFKAPKWDGKAVA